MLLTYLCCNSARLLQASGETPSSMLVLTLWHCIQCQISVEACAACKDSCLQASNREDKHDDAKRPACRCGTWRP